MTRWTFILVENHKNDHKNGKWPLLDCGEGNYSIWRVFGGSHIIYSTTVNADIFTKYLFSQICETENFVTFFTVNSLVLRIHISKQVVTSELIANLVQQWVALLPGRTCFGYFNVSQSCFCFFPMAVYRIRYQKWMIFATGILYFVFTNVI